MYYNGQADEQRIQMGSKMQPSVGKNEKPHIRSSIQGEYRDHNIPDGDQNNWKEQAQRPWEGPQHNDLRAGEE